MNATVKQQTLYVGTANLTVEILHKTTGNLLKTNIVPLVFQQPIPAASQKVADGKLMDMAKAAYKTATVKKRLPEGHELDLDYVDFVCLPFCG